MTSEVGRLIDAARKGRCLLREKWNQAAVLSGRDQLALLRVLLEVKPVQVERGGHRVPCEPAFTLRPKDRRRVVEALIADGEQDGFIMANVPGLTDRTFRRIKADTRSPQDEPANGSGKGRIRPKRNALVGTPGYASFDATSGANPEAHRRLLDALSG